MVQHDHKEHKDYVVTNALMVIQSITFRGSQIGEEIYKQGNAGKGAAKGLAIARRAQGCEGCSGGNGINYCRFFATCRSGLYESKRDGIRATRDDQSCVQTKQP